MTFNLPMLSAGSKIAFQGAYAHGAIGYSGAGSPAWGEQDQGFNTNGNGTLFPMADAIFTVDRQFLVAVERLVGCGSVDLEGLAELRDRPGSRLRQRRLRQHGQPVLDWLLSQKATAWWVGAVFDWSPVKNLDFALDAVYESSHQSTPIGWTSTRRRPVPQQLGRLQRPPARRALVLSERANRLQISAPERKLRGFLSCAPAPGGRAA